MGSLDAHKDKNEVFHKIVGGNWKSLFPRTIYSDISEWFDRQKEQKRVAVRFTFCHPPKNERYAMYVVCSPKLKKDLVQIHDFQVSEENPLAIPMGLYDMPLFCMPRDLLKRILKKRKKKP